MFAFYPCNPRIQRNPRTYVLKSCLSKKILKNKRDQPGDFFPVPQILIPELNDQTAFFQFAANENVNRDRPVERQRTRRENGKTPQNK